MIRYTVQLVHPQTQLDLKTKSPAIEAVLERIRDGAKNSHVKGLHSYRELHIDRDHITVTVDEDSKSWHRSFGKILANEYRMRAYCDPRNEHRLFKWNDRN